MSRNKKQRRNMRKILAHGSSAAPTHRGRSGRTGGMHQRKTPAKKLDRLDSRVDTTAPTGPYWTWR